MIALLALAIGPAGGVACYSAEPALRPVPAERAAQTSVATAQATVAAAERYSPFFRGYRETDGLSRNPDDCASYGCVDNGGE